MRSRFRSLLGIGAAVAVALTGAVVVGAGGAAASSSYRPPVSTFQVGDPGITWDGKQFVNFFTGWRGSMATAKDANGPWTLSWHTALSADPGWALQTSKKHPHPSYWAPDAIEVSPGRWMIVYAAQRNDSSYLRCIGVGYSTVATGPYRPAEHPLACIGGKYGAPDKMKGDIASDSVIDPTLRYLTVGGKRGLYVTYKTQRSYGTPGTSSFHYYSTIRIVQVDPTSGYKTTRIIGTSHEIWVNPHNIEENPVMVQRGSTFTLFTSVGGYPLCSYHTEYKVSSTPFTFKKSATHVLSFPYGTDTCGTGDADVFYSPQAKAYRIFFSARPGGSGKEHPFYLYVGGLAFSGSTPKVTVIYNRKT